MTVSWKCHPALQDTDGTFFLILQWRCFPYPVSLLWGYRHSLFKLVFSAYCIPNPPTLISGYLDFLFQLVSDNILMPESASTKALPRNWHEMSSSNLCSGFFRTSLLWRYPWNPLLYSLFPHTLGAVSYNEPDDTLCFHCWTSLQPRKGYRLWKLKSVHPMHNENSSSASKSGVSSVLFLPLTPKTILLTNCSLSRIRILPEWIPCKILNSISERKLPFSQ